MRLSGTPAVAATQASASASGAATFSATACITAAPPCPPGGPMGLTRPALLTSSTCPACAPAECSASCTPAASPRPVLPTTSARASASAGPASQAARAGASAKSSATSVKPGYWLASVGGQPLRDSPSTRQPRPSRSAAMAWPSPWLWPVTMATRVAAWVGDGAGGVVAGKRKVWLIEKNPQD